MEQGQRYGDVGIQFKPAGHQGHDPEHDRQDKQGEDPGCCIEKNVTNGQASGIGGGLEGRQGGGGGGAQVGADHCGSGAVQRDQATGGRSEDNGQGSTGGLGQYRGQKAGQDEHRQSITRLDQGLAVDSHGQ